MDAFTSSRHPVAHLWCREIPAASFWDTALRVDTYGYRRTGGEASALVPSVLPWDSFARLWESRARTWVHDAAPCIIVTSPSNRKRRNRVYHAAGLIAVVADTSRTGGSSAEPIYEIVWSGKYADGVLSPATPDLNFKQLLDAIAATLPEGGVLFATSGCDTGGVRTDWSDWNVGRSGAHATYIYNYMPPAFGACRILMIRDEI
jgi:hypothetical protein